MDGKYENQNPIEKLHPEEPYFFLRSQDIYAPKAIRTYAGFLYINDDIKGYEECLKFADRMEQWQKDNPDKVKKPD